jgi:pyruvate/2-oxoglutarate dehydrogenase complex dihydrolipoamide dehydrogenase (E3) component
VSGSLIVAIGRAARFTSVAPVGGEVLGLVALAVLADAPALELAHTIWAYPTIR